MSTSTVLPFQIDFEKSDLRMTSYKTTVTTTVDAVQTTETKKKEVPLIAAGATLHNVLHCINEFYQAKKIHNWTNGNKLFQNIEDIFEDPQDRTFWELTLATNPSRSLAQFDIFIKEYIADKFSNDTKAYRTHKRFLNAIKKTKHLSVHQFVSLVQYHNSNILPLLPGAPDANASYSSEDLKDIIFNSMPDEWKDAFDLLLDIDDATLPVLTKYMEKRNTIAKKKGKRNNSSTNNKKNNEDDSSEGNGKGKQGRGKGKGRGRNNRNNTRGRENNQQGRNRNQQQSGRIRDSDPCPLPGHSGHNWGDCFQNINNPNANRRNSNNNNRNNQNDNNRDNHVNENNTNGNNNGSNRDQNPQQGDNYYCQFVESGHNHNDYTDLFHVDCDIDDQYFDDDLQRFPTNQTATVEYEEVFATDDNSEHGLEHKHISPAPPVNAVGFQRLSKPKQNDDLAPTTVIVCNQINDGIKTKSFFKTLFDSGSTDNIVIKEALPKNTEFLLLPKAITMNTAQGDYTCKHYCILKNVMFPELSLTRRCKAIKCLVIESKMRYQVILGRKYMKQIGITMDFARSSIMWYGKEITFHPRNFFKDNDVLRKVLSNEPYSVAESYMNQARTYQDAATKYEETDLEGLVKTQEHLDDTTKKALLDILKKHSVLFAGLNNRQLGIFPNRKYHIELQQDAKAFHIKQPYSVPLNQQEAVKTELLRQLKLGIIERCYSTEWGMPMFIIPKPDGSCRLIADFRELNKVTKQLHYPLPKIQEIFHRRRNFKYVTLLDVSMQFHTFLLDKTSQDKCVIVTPFGKFKYLRLPMGFLNSPSWAQAAMDELFSDLTDVEVYIDDVGIFSTDFKSHCRVVHAVLTKLQSLLEKTC